MTDEPTYNPLSPPYTTVSRDCREGQHQRCNGQAATGYTAPMKNRPWQSGPQFVPCTCDHHTGGATP